MQSNILKFMLITNCINIVSMEYEFRDEPDMENTQQNVLENNEHEIVIDINESEITKSTSQSTKNKNLIEKIKKAIKEKDLATIILLMHNNEMKNLQEFMKKIQLNKDEQDAINNINIRRTKMWNICQTSTTIIVMGILAAITQLLPKYVA